jgi:integrase
MNETIDLMDGALHVYRRENSGKWQCSTCLHSRNYRQSTKSDNLILAQDFAKNWYLGLLGQSNAGLLEEAKKGKKFEAAARQLLEELPMLTHGQRSERYVNDQKKRLESVILPFLGNRYLSEAPASITEYRIHRAQTCKTGKPPSRSTMHQEIVLIRQVYKCALRHKWIDHLPDFSVPYKASGKVGRRAWFSPEEYKTLYTATRERALKPKKTRWKKACENLHDYVLFMANTGLRPDEAKRLQYRDVTIVTDESTSQRILEIEVRGKRGVGYCKSMPGAVKPFERMRERNRPASREIAIFGNIQRELFNTILDELGFKTDRDGQRRSAYSLRHTYICFRLMEGADIYQLAKNCRTSVEMIQKFYADHIKNMLDASAINVRKERQKIKQVEDDAQA